MAKEYKFVCESAQHFADWKAAIEEAAGKDANKEAYPAANRSNLVALGNGKSGRSPFALIVNLYITMRVCVCVRAYKNIYYSAQASREQS